MILFYLTHKSTLIIVMFAVSILAVPLVSMDIANTTAIQYVSTLLRWLTILIVILLPVIGKLRFSLKCLKPNISVNHEHEHKFSYSKTNWSGVPLMFGIANNSFGCHEVLPSLLYPINKKRRSNFMLAITFGVILLLFLVLTSAALTSFDGSVLSDVYLLNFQVR